MWFPGDDDDDDGREEEPFFVPSNSSNDDEAFGDDAPLTSNDYKGSPVQRPSTSRSRVQQGALVPTRDGTGTAQNAKGASQSDGSFSPYLPATTTATTGNSASSSSASGRGSHDANSHLNRNNNNNDNKTNSNKNTNSNKSHSGHGQVYLSMDDLLFGSEQDRRAALKRRQTEHEREHPHAENGHPHPSAQHDASSHGHLTGNSGGGSCVSVIAGGSVMAAPRPRTPPWPKSLDLLRGMTSADVRGVLEPFFLRKEAWEQRFRHVEAGLLPELAASAADGDNAKDGESGQEQGALLPQMAEGGELGQPVDLLMKDRCARLVNTRNWFPTGDAAEPNTALDVLLPAALVPWSPCNADGIAATAAMAVPTSTRPAIASSATPAVTASSPSSSPPPPPRLLRRHQIDGIRFMWNTLVEAPVGQVPAVGSILAHTMGLGKTGQVIVFLHLFMQCFHTAPPSNSNSSKAEPSGHAGRGPSRRTDTTAAAQGRQADDSVATPQRVLIVVPKSTISSWVREFDVWSRFFSPAHRLVPHVVTEHLSQRDRLRLFYEWRQRGGVLLVGYEAFVRIMEQVEAQSAFDGLGSAAGAFGLHHRAGATSDATHNQHTQQQHVARRMAMTRRRDEGDVTYGGRHDPFTELVICDEAHRLKSVQLRIVAALRGLHPLRRLLLTGTPLQNHLQEYWSMIDLCLHKYFDRLRFKTFFSDSIESTVSKTASSEQVQLARNKTFTLINEVRHFVQRVDSAPLRRELPPLNEFVVVLRLSPLQTQLYTEFLRTMQRQRSESFMFLPAVAYAGKITAHPELFYQMREEVSKETPAGSIVGSISTATKKQRATKQEKKKKKKSSAGAGAKAHSRKRGRNDRDTDSDGDDEDEEDVVVVEECGSSGTTSGSHSESEAASDTTSSGDDENAGSDDPEEWAVLQRSSKYSLSSLYRASVDNQKLNKPTGYTVKLEDGVKLNAAMLIIQRAMQNGEKTLLFSLSTKLLDFFELLIAQYNVTGVQEGGLPRPIRYCRLDGSSTSVQRAEMLKAFDGPNGPDVFLLSTKAGGVGITITAATRVILVDTSFNPADDQQAIGRAYRYGQTRPVFVYRLLCLHTLEYSIFEQKLAKEWLFQTIVDESSVKRDGLSGHGMHLRQIFDLMGRTVEKLSVAPRPTTAQIQQTAQAIHDDPVLTALEPLMTSAQRYEFFLERDTDDTYGEKEKAYYNQYQEQRPFNVRDDTVENMFWRSSEAQAQRAAQEAEEQAQLHQQTRSLTSLVDQLIRSRVDQDPNLSRLLAAMGVKLDATTGTVQPGRHLQEQRQTEQEREMSRQITPTQSPHPQPEPQQQQQTLSDSLHAAQAVQRVADASSDDSDVEELKLLLSPDEEAQERQRSAADEASRKAMARPPLVTNPSAYARYAPGRSSSTAIELDEESFPGSQEKAK